MSPIAPRLEAVGTLFETHGREQIVGGNTPVLLDRETMVWFVARGRVEVFSVPVVAGQPAGARRHFCTADEGRLLFGMALAPGGSGVGLLAVGTVGTRLLELDLADLRRWAADPATNPAIAALVEHWVTGLSAGISRDILPRPRSHVLLDAGASVPVPQGRRMTSRKGLVWTRGTAGALFIDMEAVPSRPAVLFPVTADTWLEAAHEAVVEAVPTEAAIAGDAAWTGLESLYAAVLACELVNSQLAAADELNRLHEKSARDARIRTAALSALASVLVSPAAAIGGSSADDPLLAACTIVGRAAGIAVEPPVPQAAGGPARDPLAAIAQASGFRTRQVALRGPWWTRDGGPLVASVEAGRRPVALLWRRGRYERHDPADGTAVPVDSAVAATLSPFAHTLYRPLPNRRLGLWEVLRFATERRGRDFVLPTLMGIGGGLLGLAPPYFTGRLVGTIIPAADSSELAQIAIILIVIAISTALFDIVRGLGNHRIEIGMISALQPSLWDRLLGLPAGFFRRFSAGDLAQRVVAVDTVRRFVSGVTLSTLQTAIFSVFLLAQMFYYSWRLALVATAFVVLALLIMLITAYRKLLVVRESAEVEGRISGLVLQLLTGVAKIRVAGAEHRAFSEWAREFSVQKRLAFRMGRIDNIVAVFNSVFPVISTMGLFYAMLHLTEEAGPLATAVSIGDFVALNAAAGAFLMQMTQMGTTLLVVLLVIPYCERAQPLLDTLPEVDPARSDPGEINGQIDISRVSFQYHEDGPLVLNDVSMTIKAGEYVAIVGPSGSGKSTLFRLLLGLESPTSGRVSYDGRDVAQLDVHKLRKRLGVVMQGSQIRAGSIFENIVGALPLTLDDAWEAARLAGLDEDIREMPMGMHTVLQQGGMTLSGGQRQRLMIARAIIARPRVLLFDEATSALDNRTQAVVARSLRDLQATRVTIAHRLSTIVAADRIYVLEGGRVAQHGTYHELVEQTGLFRELMRRQMV